MEKLGYAHTWNQTISHSNFTLHYKLTTATTEHADSMTDFYIQHKAEWVLTWLWYGKLNKYGHIESHPPLQLHHKIQIVN